MQQYCKYILTHDCISAKHDFCSWAHDMNMHIFFQSLLCINIVKIDKGILAAY